MNPLLAKIRVGSFFSVFWVFIYLFGLLFALSYLLKRKKIGNNLSKVEG